MTTTQDAGREPSRARDVDRSLRTISVIGLESREKIDELLSRPPSPASKLAKA